MKNCARASMWFMLATGFDGAVAVGESVCKPLSRLVDAINGDPAWQRWRTRHRLRLFDLSVYFSAHPRGDGLRIESSSLVRGRFTVDVEGSRADLAALSPLQRVQVGWDVMRCGLSVLPQELTADLPALPSAERVWPACREHQCFVTFEFDYARSSLQPYCSLGGHRLSEDDVTSPPS